MQDGLEIAAPGGVGKHQGGQGAAVEIAVGVQDAAAERGDDGVEARRPVRDDVARQRVGVDGRHAERGEDRAHVALAGSHPAGKGNALHLVVVVMAPQLGPGSGTWRAGVNRSSTNVFHSWHCGHCHSSSVLR